jgi:hypothetical protein
MIGLVCYSAFSADIQIREGEVQIEIPVLTRLPDINSKSPRKPNLKADPFKQQLMRGA